MNIKLKQNEETRIQKNEERLRNLQDNFNHSNIRIIRVPEGEEEEQEMENLFEKVMKENFPNLMKEIEVQEAQSVPKKWGPKKWGPRKHIQRHIIIILPKIKEMGRILKAAREWETVIYTEAPIRLSADFSKETLQARRGYKEVSKVIKGKALHPR